MANVRKQGHNLERYYVKALATLFGLTPYKPGVKSYNIASTRLMSKGLDDAGVDIWFKDKPYSKLAIQLKKKLSRGKDTISINVDPLDRIEEFEYPILITKVTKPAGKREKTHRTYMTVPIELGMDMLKLLINEERRVQ